MCIDSYGVTIYTFFVLWKRKKLTKKQLCNCKTLNKIILPELDFILK